ncbi:MAG TPA: serine/threonine-protein kinase [Pirellulaceae bacterium]|nr:serine/threonine-protein kinase [Pirellulaceae bacterium]
MPTTSPSVRSIFDRALDIASEAERRAFLDEACASAPEIRQQVEALLAAHAAAGSFLESPPAGVASSLEQLRAVPTDGPSLEFLTPSDKPGSLGRLGHHEILELVGTGGMGVVLKAFDEKLQRVVAIKVIAEALAASPAARKRFVREAQAAAAVRNDHVVNIHAVEDAGVRPYLVMELISGVSLQQRLDASGPLEVKEILRIGMQVAQGLAAAHAQGVVHRDITPANILLENGVERVKITDFGLARVADDASLSASGIVAGTPQYMAPEQARGEPVDHRADLFSLGSVLYAMCTGRAPFRASTTMAVLRRVVDEPPRSIRDLNSDIPDWLIEIIDRLLAKQPADRFQTASQVADLLGQHLAQVQQPRALPPQKPVDVSIGKSSAAGRKRGRWLLAAIGLLLVLCTFGLTEATGLTQVGQFVRTVLRIETPEGTLIVEVDDPQVQVTIEGDGGIAVSGAGPQQVLLRPGTYRVRASQQGQPLPDKLVTITRGGKEIVTIRRQPLAAPAVDATPADAPPQAEAEPRPFVVLDGDGAVRSAYSTLVEAVGNSTNGSIIEIRGNGPFASEPIRLSTRRTIRAGRGFQPVLTTDNKAGSGPTHVLESIAPLVLEGIHFDDPERRDAFILNSIGGPLYVANCRFTNCTLMVQHSPVECRVQNCQFTTHHGMPILLIHCPRRMRVVIASNVVATALVPAFSFIGEPDGQSLEIVRNVLLGANALQIGYVKADVQDGRPPEPIGIHAAENVLVGRDGVLHFNVTVPRTQGSPAPEATPSGAELEDLLRRVVVWHEERNLTAEGVAMLTMFYGVSKRVQPTSRYQTLAEWNQLWGLEHNTSLRGLIRFEGGDLRTKVEMMREPLVLGDFRMTSISTGYRAGAQGRDIGPDIDLVGPGAAYERWKMTPDYQQWVKETSGE